MARRREKVVYEEIPIVTQQSIPPKDLDTEPIWTAPTVGGVVTTNPSPSRIVTNDNVENEGYLEPVKRVAAQYKPAPIVSIPTPPPTSLDGEEEAKPTSSKVINITDIPREPIDESIPGYSKIFGGKKKEPITVKNVE
jgi:hypothetical protein